MVAAFCGYQVWQVWICASQVSWGGDLLMEGPLNSLPLCTENTLHTGSQLGMWIQYQLWEMIFLHDRAWIFPALPGNPGFPNESLPLEFLVSQAQFGISPHTLPSHVRFPGGMALGETLTIFLYVNSEQYEKENCKIPCTTASIRIKYLGINQVSDRLVHRKTKRQFLKRGTHSKRN